MGVTGLLQQLKDIQVPTSLSNYKGKTLAVDTYGWLHRGLILCAQDLCTNAPTKSYVTSVMKKVDMLRHFGVEPYMVFDGSPLPTKEGTEVERREKREKARDAANKFVLRGDRKSAWKEFMKAAEVTPEMAKSIMVELDRKNVKYVVAPYEADPQMVYLEKVGLVDGILSEDSDLLVFGCNRLITKLSDYGECIEINRLDFHKIKKLSLETFSLAQWRLVAILSGCDYTKGIPGVGLKTAFNLVLKLLSLEKIVLALKADSKTVPDDFMEEALKADLAFRFQKVFNPRDKRLSTLCDYPEEFDVATEVVELCCGRTLQAHIHLGICTGKIHPDSHTTLISREQSLTIQKSYSMRATSTTVTTNTNKAFTKSIESYFTVQKVEKLEDTTLRRLNESKRSNDKTIKLSPSSRKLKRLQSSKTGQQSKFFGSAPPKLGTLSKPLQTIPDPNSSFLTGDSDVPDSSPVKILLPQQLTSLPKTEEVEEYLTDLDEFDNPQNSMANSACPPLFTSAAAKSFIDSDNVDCENEIEESPVKLSKIGLLWRERFLLGSEHREEKLLKKEFAVKKEVSGATRETTTRRTALKRSPVRVDSSTEFLSPATPQDEAGLPHTDFEKSLQRDIISESEEDSLPRAPQRSSTFRLLQFAFSGH